jgi:gas vesicle protein
MSEQDKVEGFLLGTIVGAAVAGITALLFAPKSGKELRGDIADQAEEAKYQAKEYIDIAKEKGVELKETAETASSDYLENASTTFGKVVDQVKGGANKTGENLEAIKQEAAATAEDVKETVAEGKERDLEITKEAAEDVKETVEEGVEEGKDAAASNDGSGVSQSEAKRRTVDFDYDEEHFSDSEEAGQKTENVATEQRPESGGKDEDTTNTNVGI